MIDHVGIAVGDLDRSRTFYEAALAPPGVATIRTQTNTLGNRIALMGDDAVFFVIAEGELVGGATHVAFAAETTAAAEITAQVDAFHAAALAGGRDNGAPGFRPDYGTGYYAAFVLDPDGMNVEAVCHLEALHDELHHRL